MGSFFFQARGGGCGRCRCDHLLLIWLRFWHDNHAEGLPGSQERFGGGAEKNCGANEAICTAGAFVLFAVAQILHRLHIKDLFQNSIL